MKPSFALSFTEDSIQLLHRMGKGWVNIGETLFEAPDLDEALAIAKQVPAIFGGVEVRPIVPS